MVEAERMARPDVDKQGQQYEAKRSCDNDNNIAAAIVQDAWPIPATSVSQLSAIFYASAVAMAKQVRRQMIKEVWTVGKYSYNDVFE